MLSLGDSQTNPENRHFPICTVGGEVEIITV